MPKETTKFYFIPKEEMARMVTEIEYKFTIAVGQNGSLTTTGHRQLTLTLSDYVLPPHIQQKLGGRRLGTTIHFFIKDPEKHLFREDDYSGNRDSSYLMSKLKEYEI